MDHFSTLVKLCLLLAADAVVQLPARVGDRLEMRCSRTENRVANWYKDGLPLAVGVKAVLSDVTNSDSGLYTCNTTDYMDRSFNVSVLPAVPGEYVVTTTSRIQDFDRVFYIPPTDFLTSSAVTQYSWFASQGWIQVANKTIKGTIHECEDPRCKARFGDRVNVKGYVRDNVTGWCLEINNSSKADRDVFFLIAVRASGCVTQVRVVTYNNSSIPVKPLKNFWGLTFHLKNFEIMVLVLSIFFLVSAAIWLIYDCVKESNTCGCCPTVKYIAMTS
ncbi:membrane protein ORF146 [Cyprinid herpesvirus 1]|uniref:Membrane protein ORF146 n=1 Tax=Cyprinid herpesvirus 1 TaxID=317858 RepID=K7PBY7_9VIRU|nr:membrane protein ORF146 [Cyprinid herpesvirus 1]AFJ20433.1 membrane protein ORF146 [Cyprinid herpesvirus 1]